jgi:ATP-dependent Lon protease
MKTTMTKIEENNNKKKDNKKHSSKKRVVEEESSSSSYEEDDDDSDYEEDEEEDDESSEYEDDDEDDEDYEEEETASSESCCYKKKQRNKSGNKSDEENEIGKSLFKLLKRKAQSIIDEESDSKKRMKKSKKQRRLKKEQESDEEDQEDEEDEDEDDEDEEEEEDEGQQGIILSFDAFGGPPSRNEETDYKQMIKEDRNEKCNSDDEETFMKESYTHIVLPDTPQTSPNTTAKNRDKKKKKTETPKHKKKNKEVEVVDTPTIDDQYKELVTLRQDLIEQLAKQPNSKILRNAIKECKRSISEMIKKERNKNAHDYYKLVHKDQKDKKNTNEISYFKKNLSHKEQMRVMKDLKEINAFTNTDKPYRLALLESNIPPKFKAIALQKLHVLNSMGPSDSEYYKMKNWVDGFMRVPFGLYKHLNVKLEDGTDKCSGFLKNAKNTLDSCTYGLNDAKLQILQMLGQWISNKDALGTAIAIKGPPGTGKTTLVKEGISKILGRDFAFIALGGTGDASFLEGHSYTYEGSSWGKIVSILMESKSMNPVIYFDELDKISDTPKGEEITSILTHLTDTSQNNQFSDKYFSEVHFDLSKCLFIFSYNDESKVNPILKDRMYRIQTNGYESKEKIIIARKHILPKIREQINFEEGEIIIPDDTLQYIISKFCKEEQGVRNLKRCLEIIHTKLNLFRLVNKEDNLFEKDIAIEVSFPFTVEKKHVDILIKTDDPMNQSMLAMYM